MIFGSMARKTLARVLPASSQTLMSLFTLAPRPTPGKSLPRENPKLSPSRRELTSTTKSQLTLLVFFLPAPTSKAGTTHRSTNTCRSRPKPAPLRLGARAPRTSSEMAVGSLIPAPPRSRPQLKRSWRRSPVPGGARTSPSPASLAAS